MEKEKPLTIKELATAMMDYRLDSLALLKTLDRAGVPVNILDRSMMNAWANMDADLLEGLAMALRLPEAEIIPSQDAAHMLALLQQGKQIKRSIVEKLPRRYLKKVEELLPVGELVVDEDDVYAELPELPPIPAHARP